MEKLYKERDIEELDELGDFYCKHVMAMTTEALHDKSSIAAELGFRDQRITELEEELEAYKLIMANEVEPLINKICNSLPTDTIKLVESEAFMLGHHPFVLNAAITTNSKGES